MPYKEDNYFKCLIAAKIFYDKNRQNILEKRHQRLEKAGRINCPCGGKYYNLNSYAQVHFNSIKHMKYLQ